LGRDRPYFKGLALVEEAALSSGRAYLGTRTQSFKRVEDEICPSI
jgi:hypothetical protein